MIILSHIGDILSALGSHIWYKQLLNASLKSSLSVCADWVSPDGQIGGSAVAPPAAGKELNEMTRRSLCLESRRGMAGGGGGSSAQGSSSRIVQSFAA